MHHRLAAVALTTALVVSFLASEARAIPPPAAGFTVPELLWLDKSGALLSRLSASNNVVAIVWRASSKRQQLLSGDPRVAAVVRPALLTLATVRSVARRCWHAPV